MYNMYSAKIQKAHFDGWFTKLCKNQIQKTL